MLAVRCLLAWETTKGWVVQRAKAAHQDERGLVQSPWVILTGLAVIAAILIGGLIFNALESHTRNIVNHINGAGS